MSVIQKQIFEMMLVLPENKLSIIKPLLEELLTSAVLTVDPTANVSEMDETDKTLFLRAVYGINSGDYISFDEALNECGIELNEIFNCN